ncbi:RNA polymerase sigma factor SigE [Timonella senegalensis]|uniref:RNA polymerase sigma factor SigE n=1 Tax=Timonella senegalensis TaxID=1465825 RepID=UPI0028A966BD|nr:RNA polymerase sigma factor SigE [Timonella senegalensis]
MTSGSADPQADAHAASPVTSSTPWETIVAEHSQRVYRLSYRLTGNQQDAEDLTQEVFIRVFKSLGNFQPGSFEGWLHRITTNVFLDQVRRKKRIRMDHMGEEAATYADTSEFGSPERGFEHLNLDYDIQEALDKLAPEYRVAVVLCDIEGLPYEEIAATLGIKLGTVRSRIHRARSQLRKHLAHRAPRAAAGNPSVSGDAPLELVPAQPLTPSFKAGELDSTARIAS